MIKKFNPMNSTFGQLSKTQKRRRDKHKPRALAFSGAPHRKGIIYKITPITPRKPNSAKRTIAKVKLNFNEKRIFAKIPGIGEHFLQVHAQVFVRGHGPKDSPGINYHLIRGKEDFTKEEKFGRRNRRSKFGVKRPG
jgi:small subunit ribosomal protein S12